MEARQASFLGPPVKRKVLPDGSLAVLRFGSAKLRLGRWLQREPLMKLRDDCRLGNANGVVNAVGTPWPSATRC